MAFRTSEFNDKSEISSVNWSHLAYMDVPLVTTGFPEIALCHPEFHIVQAMIYKLLRTNKFWTNGGKKDLLQEDYEFVTKC